MGCQWKKALGFAGSGAAILVGRCASVRMHHEGTDGALTREALGELASWVHAWGVEHDLPTDLVFSGEVTKWDEEYVYLPKKPSGLNLPRIAVGLRLAECPLGRTVPISLDVSAEKKRAKELSALFDALEERPEASGIFTATESNGETTRWRSNTELREAKAGEFGPILAVTSGCAGAIVVGVEAKQGTHKKRGMRDWDGKLFGKVFPREETSAIDISDAKIRNAQKALASLGEPDVYLAACRL